MTSLSTARAVARDAAGSPGSPSLLQHYNRYFEVVRANTPVLKEEAHRIRFQVYCVERSFEAAPEFADGLERDRYDLHGVQALLRHRPSGEFMGTIRLILPSFASQERPLPAADILREQGIDLYAHCPRGHTGELSRFAVRKSFRQRLTDTVYPDAASDARRAAESERRVAPVITLGLMMAALQMGLEHRLSHACAIVEPALLRLLGRHGIEMSPLGRVVEYHGLRQPCFVDAEKLLSRMRHSRPDIWEVITDRGRLLPADVG